MTILVTGGAGFIGSNFINIWNNSREELVINLDNLSYSGNINNFDTKPDNEKHVFVKGDINDKKLIHNLFNEYNFRAVINFAAESHVDRSIHGPEAFIKTNILGTFNLLECTRDIWGNLNANHKKRFRFLHVSTDEVYGSLKTSEKQFTEQNRYKPNSPYSASKASSDHLVRAYNKTYGLPTLITNCSNNYGPYQFPEKLIPLIIHNALKKKSLPIYGDGKQIRDWLYVEDHCDAICKVLDEGDPGEVYNIGGNNEKTNLEIVNYICEILDKLKPVENSSDIKSYKELISFVKDRPGHDRRYAIDSTKIYKTLKWKPTETFETGILKSIQWYLNNQEWVEKVVDGSYQDWIKKQYK